MDVGNRTTIRIMYPEAARAQEPGTQLLLLPLNSSGLEWFIKTLHLQHSVRKPQNPGYDPQGTVMGAGDDNGDAKELFLLNIRVTPRLT